MRSPNDMKPFKLEDHAPIQPGFKTPDGYFDTLQQNVMQRIASAPEVRVIPLYRRKAGWISAAAAVIVLCFTIPFTNKMMTENNSPDLASLENYIGEDSGLTQYDLVNLLDNNDLQKTGQESAPTDKDIEEALLDNNNLEHYIID